MEPNEIVANERDLIQRIKGNDHAAFHLLYNTYKRPVANKLLYLLKSDELVKDTLQDLFLKIWELRASINPDQSFPAFLNRVARNMVTDIFRKAFRDQQLREQLLIEADEAFPPLEEEIIARESELRLHQAILQLPERQREVFVLHKIEGKSYKEISEQLSIGQAAINQHIYRAKQTLIQLLSSKLWFITILFSATILKISFLLS